MSAKTRILIVDDHPFTREGVRFFLEERPEFEVIGEAADGAQAIAMALELGPDVVVMDFRLPAIDGLEATRRLCLALPGVHVLVFTAEKNAELPRLAREAGALAWLPKDTPASQFLEAIQSLSRGKPYPA
jgi:DNA-binding NarL/FixJ family response regulator